MKNLLELKASLGRISQDEREYGIFAEASGTYEGTAKILTMKQTCYLQETSAATPKSIHPSWLPKDQTDHEHVDHDEATDLGREIFQRWCDSVRHSSPVPLH